MLKKLVIVSILPLTGLTACDDAQQCVGHICGGDVTLQTNEGGGVAFEYIHLDSDLRNANPAQPLPETILRVTSYFVNHQMPELNPFPAAAVCTNLIAEKAWPIYSGSPEYLSAGSVTIKGKNAAGADVTIPNMKMSNMKDPFQRTHETFYLNISPNAPELAKPNSAFTVEFGGEGAFEATTETDALFLAESFTVKNPGLEDNTPIQTDRDFTVQWNPVESTNLPPGDQVLGVTWLVDQLGGPTHMCPTLHAAGQFTVPAAALQEHKAIQLARGQDGTGMILLRNAIVHKLATLPNGDAENKRRIDMVSLYCHAQFMPLQ